MFRGINVGEQKPNEVCPLRIMELRQKDTSKIPKYLDGNSFLNNCRSKKVSSRCKGELSESEHSVPLRGKQPSSSLMGSAQCSCQKKFRIRHLGFHFTQLEKEKINPNQAERQKSLRGKLNETERRFSEKINKIDKALARPIRDRAAAAASGVEGGP